MSKTMKVSIKDKSDNTKDKIKSDGSVHHNDTGSSLMISYLQRNVVPLAICTLTIIIILLTITILVILNREIVVVNVEKITNKRNSLDVGGGTTQKTVATVLPDSNENVTLFEKLKLVSRLEWLAQPPVEQADPLPVPVPYVIIHQTSTENCTSQTQCIFHVRLIQTFHMESRNWWDIGYNFLVGGDGKAYEGRGWKSEGAHTYGYNSKSIGIAFIGTFNTFKPPQRQIEACKQLIAEGVRLGYVKEDYKLLAARQLHNTPSPGMMLYEDLKTWNHWSSTP